MKTPGLSESQPTAGGLPPLPEDVPSLRLSLPDRYITAASPALVTLTGRPIESLVGRAVSDLWHPSEREAIEHRFDDVVLLGQDVFGALALAPDGAPVAWVEVDARYLYQGGQRLEVDLCPLEVNPPLGEDATKPTATPAATPAEGAADPPAGGAAAPAVSAHVEPPCPPESEVPTEVLPAPSGATDRPPQYGGRSSVAMLVMAALEAAGAAAVAVRPDGAIASATPEAERVLGTPIARLRGTPLTRLLALSETAEEAVAVARSGRLRQSVLAHLPDGEEGVVLEWVPGDEPGAGYGVLATDVPESETSERLRMQARLVSFVAHDVRESLAAVYCGLRTLADELPDDAPQRVTLGRVMHESSRANRIVDEVLAVSRPGRLTRVELDLADILRETIARHGRRAASSGVEIRESLPPGICVMVDLSSLERVFDNLIENALQATPHCGTLTITAQLEDRARPGVRVSVADTGVGIKPGIRPNVFEPFVTDKSNGTGLGLAITRRVVLDHEGQIDFESEEGRGTTFHVWLPRVAS